MENWHTESNRSSAAVSDIEMMRVLRGLPDLCATDVADLAIRVGTEKLEIIRMMRSDAQVARLIEKKLIR